MSRLFAAACVVVLTSSCPAWAQIGGLNRPFNVPTPDHSKSMGRYSGLPGQVRWGGAPGLSYTVPGRLYFPATGAQGGYYSEPLGVWVIPPTPGFPAMSYDIAGGWDVSPIAALYNPFATPISDPSGLFLPGNIGGDQPWPGFPWPLPGAL